MILKLSSIKNLKWYKYHMCVLETEFSLKTENICSVIQNHRSVIGRKVRNTKVSNNNIGTGGRN